MNTTPSTQPQKEPRFPKLHAYIGSVRFFKNLILLVVIICIAVPTGTSIALHGQLTHSREEVDSLKDELSLQADTVSVASPVPLATTPPVVEPEPEPEPLAEAMAYQELYPDFYAPEPLSADQKTDKVIYLTFDDGPSARTPEILEILRQQDVKATFFVIGQSREENLQWMRDIVAEGHTLGMHSYTHKYDQIYSSVEAYLEDMYRLFTQIKETTGVTPSVFRFPGGSINGYSAGIYQELIAEMLRRGFVPYDWNISSEDATGSYISPDKIVSNITATAGRVNRGFVLMHDSEAKGTTVAALSPMIDRLREMGFTFEKLTPDVKPVLFSYD